MSKEGGLNISLFAPRELIAAQGNLVRLCVG